MLLQRNLPNRNVFWQVQRCSQGKGVSRRKPHTTTARFKRLHASQQGRRSKTYVEMLDGIACCCKPTQASATAGVTPRGLASIPVSREFGAICRANHLPVVCLPAHDPTQAEIPIQAAGDWNATHSTNACSSDPQLAFVTRRWHL